MQITGSIIGTTLLLLGHLRLGRRSRAPRQTFNQASANLRVFTLVTHRNVFAGDAPSGEAKWSLIRALSVMVAGTAVIALEAELASTALEATSSQLGLSPVFMGVIVTSEIRSWGVSRMPT